MFNHIEYDTASLADEYWRDINAGKPDRAAASTTSPTTIPSAARRTAGAATPISCSATGSTVYQTTPFDFAAIGGAAAAGLR